MGVELVNIGKLQRRLVAMHSGALQKALVADLHKSAEPIHRDMQAATRTRIERRAMDSVVISKRTDGVEFSAGVVGGLGATLFRGAEFGGQTKKPKKVRGYVYGHLVRKTPGFVTRRTTMMFEPWNWWEGAFFYPTLREWEPKLIDQAAETVAEFLAGGV